MGFTQWQWYYNKTQNKNTHITRNITLKQTTTQSYTNNKGHITYNEYKKKSKVIPATGSGGLWGCEMSRLPALHTGWALPSKIFRHPRLSKPQSHGAVGRIRSTERKQ
jgi:hypothetical protein